MTATDELRKMLDELGVEWERGLPTETIVRKPIDVLYVERPDGRMHAYVRSYLTPEQAIAATLSSYNCTNGERTNGTCHMRLAYEEEDADGFIWPDHYECSVCGANVNGIMPSCDTEVPPRFCPNCGKKVVP